MSLVLVGALGCSQRSAVGVEADATDGAEADITDGSSDTSDSNDGPSPIVEIAGSLDDVCARREDGSVECWNRIWLATHVPTGKFKEIAPPCGVTLAGDIACWEDHPLEVLDGEDGPFRNLDFMKDLSCAIDGAGAIQCVGSQAPDELPTAHAPYLDIAVTIGMLCWVAEDSASGCANPLFASWALESITPVDIVGFLTAVCGRATTGEVECSDFSGNPVDLGWSDNEHIKLLRDFWSGGGICGLTADGSVLCAQKAGVVTQILGPGHETFGLMGEVVRGSICGLRDQAIDCIDPYGNRTLLQPSSDTFTSVEVVASICALDTNGELHCNWAGGVLPAGPLIAFSLLEGVDNVTSGCAIHADGHLECWGAQVIWNWDTPPTEGFIALGVREANSGDTEGCAIQTNGEIRCWGFSLLPSPPGNFKALSINVGACAIDDDGMLQCWAGAPNPPAGVFTAVDVGNYTACGVREDRSITCWHDTLAWNTPGFILDVPGEFMDVEIGAMVACGLRLDHTIECWNLSGAPGAPAAASGEFVDISLDSSPEDGRPWGCGIRTDGSIECWG